MCVDNNTDSLTFVTSQAGTAKTIEVWFLIFPSFHLLSPSLSPRDLQHLSVYSGNVKSLEQQPYQGEMRNVTCDEETLQSLLCFQSEIGVLSRLVGGLD